MSSFRHRPESPFRAPEPIRDLIAAINDNARAAQTGLFTMMALGIYIIATFFPTTDLDLLMEKSLQSLNSASSCRSWSASPSPRWCSSTSMRPR